MNCNALISIQLKLVTCVALIGLTESIYYCNFIPLALTLPKIVEDNPNLIKYAPSVTQGRYPNCCCLELMNSGQSVWFFFLYGAPALKSLWLQFEITSHNIVQYADLLKRGLSKGWLLVNCHSFCDPLSTV
jgi:hypothetical protein